MTVFAPLLPEKPRHVDGVASLKVARAAVRGILDRHADAIPGDNVTICTAETRMPVMRKVMTLDGLDRSGDPLGGLELRWVLTMAITALGEVLDRCLPVKESYEATGFLDPLMTLTAVLLVLLFFPVEVKAVVEGLRTQFFAPRQQGGVLVTIRTTTGGVRVQDTEHIGVAFLEEDELGRLACR